MTVSAPPIFQSIFGEQWASLPPVLQAHYANRGYCSDKVTVEGLMRVEMSALARILSPMMRLTGTLAPYEGQGIPVTVHFESEPTNNAFCFNRIFHYPGLKPFRFRSRMVPVGDNRVVEFMRSGFGWYASYDYDGQKVLMKHLGYKIKILGKVFSLPLEPFLGEGYAEEEALSDEEFRMSMEIWHPWFGKVYAYSGTFKLRGSAHG